ncbi:sulfotransferase family protein [Herbidospora mongoliensis]|uniref:sulfotransferase family protein n=1 Tax=Herbidospora mongoliensis TaxID=688067 RepID=UPI000AA27930|nr:sulfotransferase [Herbidospora mongoliensis]
MIFVGGLGRSGTTLLERLLGELPGVAPLGEVVHLWHRGVRANEPCGCGRPFSQCRFWHEVGDRAFGGWRPAKADRLLELRHKVDRTRRVPVFVLGLISREAQLTEYVASYHRIYAAAAEVVRGQVVIDSSKHASLAYCLSAILDLTVVHVVRDPRAVAASWRRKVARPEDGRPMARWSPARTAVHWFVQNLAYEVLRRKGVPIVRVHYEDLVEKPADTLRALAGKLGLPDSHEALAFITGRTARLGVAHTVSGNPMRFHVGRVRFRDRRPDLPFPHRWAVTALTLPLLLWYGYRLNY